MVQRDGLIESVSVYSYLREASYLRASLRESAPELGQHSSEVLTEYGFAPEEITQLFEAGVVQ